MFEQFNQADISFSYAPGKVILVGEHAVVYGAKAIAMPIDCGVRVAIMHLPANTPKPGPMIRGVGPYFMGDTYLDQSSPGPQVLKSALAYLVEAFGHKAHSLAIVVDGSLPPGRGLGSSASLSVALIRGIYRFLALNLDATKLLEHAMALETIFHGQPSGIDHSVVIGGQVIAFKRQGDQVELKPLMLKSDLSLVLGIVGPHDGTKNAVQELAVRKKRQEKAYASIFSGLDEIACDMEQALVSGQLASVGELMNIAQGYLNAMLISNPEIEKLCAIARERGALGAKLTGAGGGGAVIALSDGNDKEVLAAFKAAGYQSLIAQVARV